MFCSNRFRILTNIVTKAGSYIGKTHNKYLVSFTFPASITNTTSGMVIPVSAMFVARTTFLTPAGGVVNARAWSADDNTECRAITRYLLNKCDVFK